MATQAPPTASQTASEASSVPSSVLLTTSSAARPPASSDRADPLDPADATVRDHPRNRK